MCDNLRTGGEGRHFDRQGEIASANSHEIVGMANLFKAAVRLGDDVALPQWNGKRELLTDTISYEMNPECAGLLLKALAFNESKDYEKANKALHEFVQALADRYATDYVELSQ